MFAKTGLKKFAADRQLFISVIILFTLTTAFVIYPVWKALELSIQEEGVWSLQSYLYIWQKSWLKRSFMNSMILGSLSATFSVIVGYLFAFLVCRTQTKLKGLLRMMATLPIISPPFMLTLSMILLFGKNGFITRHLLDVDVNVYGLWGLVVVQTVTMFPIAYLTMIGVLSGIDSSIEDAALDLGASRLRTFFRVTFRLSIPGVISSWLLVFVTSLADFANPIILAGKFDVLSVQAYLQFTGMGNLELGAALSILLLCPSLIAYFIQKYYLSKKSFVTVTGKPQRRSFDLVTPGALKAMICIAFLIALFILLLFVTVLAGCFTKSWGIDYTLSLENFKYVFDVGWKTIADTTLLSVIAAPIAGILGLFIAFLVVRKNFPGRKILDTVAMLPFALPGTLVGIGLILAFNAPPLLLTGTATIIVLCFVYRQMPVGIEAAKASLMQIDPAIEEAATDLGAGTLKVFRKITLPLIKPAMFAGMAYAFVRSMTAVSAVIFLVSAKWNHMTVLILAQTEILRYSAAAVLCLIQILIVMGAFWIIRKILKVDIFQQGAV